MKKFAKTLLLLISLMFVSPIVMELATPQAHADVVGDLTRGKETTNQAVKIIIAVSLTVAVGGCIALCFIPQYRRVGMGFGAAIVVVVIVVLIARNSFIGETITDVNNASDVSDILSK